MKRFICWVLALTSVLALAVSAFAHDRKDHDKDINDVLFENESFPGYSEKGKKLKDLEDAIALCIDQFNGSDYRLLTVLRNHGIHGIPQDISTIDLDHVNSYTHRSFTHLGWNYHYEDNKDWEKKWKTRRTILLETVKEVFGFQSNIKMVGLFKFEKVYDDQCDAFAAFLYYLHILSDYKYYDEGQRDTLTDQVMPLVSNGEDKDIFSELESIFPVLFENSVTERSYIGLEQNIKQLENDAEKLDSIRYTELANSLLEELESRVPALLKAEPFFSKVFYPDGT